MVNHLKKARGEIWPKHSERRNNTKAKKNYQDEEKKSAVYIKKKFNSQIKKPHLKMILIKDNYNPSLIELNLDPVLMHLNVFSY